MKSFLSHSNFKMAATHSDEYTQILQQLMKEQGIPSFRKLSWQSGVSERQLQQLRRGHILQMRLEVVLKLSRVLHVSVQGLLTQFSSTQTHPSLASPGFEEVRKEGKMQSIDDGKQAVALTALEEEYRRLQQQLKKQQETLLEEFQRSSLQAIESWLVYWPAAAVKAKENPDLPAARLLPLVKPLEQLLQQWQVEEIAPVGEELNYDPQWHQLVEGIARPGDRVCVRYAGYRHRGQLLFRAVVTPVA
jgi:molecular chaperone GrpE (heat shock protein)